MELTVRPGRVGLACRLGALAVATTVVGGCAAGATDTRTGPTPPPVLLRSADLRLPLDTYLLSVAQVREVARANDRLVRSCMRRYGYTLTSPPAGADVGPSTWNERRYGLTDPVQAARYGYGLGDRDPLKHPVKSAEPAPTSPTELQVLDGLAERSASGLAIPPGGCTGEARRRLTARAPQVPDSFLAQRLSVEGFQVSRRDPTVVDVTRRWSSCMLGKGYRYAGPLDPPADRALAGRPVGRQIATAEADVACKASTNLVGVWSTAEATVQRHLIAANLPALRVIVAANRAELTAASGVAGA